MLSARLMATTDFPQPAVGEVTPRNCQDLSSIDCSTCVRSISNDFERGSWILCAIILLDSKCAALRVISAPHNCGAPTAPPFGRYCGCTAGPDRSKGGAAAKPDPLARSIASLIRSIDSTWQIWALISIGYLNRAAIILSNKISRGGRMK